MKLSLASLALFAVVVSTSFAQGQEDTKTPPATTPPAPVKTQTTQEPWDDFLRNLQPRQLGPVTMGGRITDLAVYEKEPRIYYAATASGGLFKTVNAGLTFTPVFEREATISLGATAVSQSDPNLVWVGTGEATSRNSVAWGNGVYRSTDGGKTWQHMGLPETHHIGKIVIDPRNSNTVYVAATGRLWGPNPERGVYKTTDGGKTWQHVLKVDSRTGAVDLVMDPRNPENLLVAMWHRERKPWDFISGGPGGGLYKTTNGGKWWRRVEKGLPGGPYGRIGLNYMGSNPKVVVATIEYRPDEKKEPNRPKDQGIVRRNGGGTFISRDGGDSWTMLNVLNPRPFYFSIPKIDPNDEKRIYVPSDNLYVSEDAGKTFKPQNNKVHPDYHAFWINPSDSNHIIAGTDGGIFETRDRGTTWEHHNGMPIAQYYAIGVDMRRPYWVYGGLQDNSCWGLPTQTMHGKVSSANSVLLGGGDGFQTLADPNDWATVYWESQGGRLIRTDLKSGASKGIRPALAGEPLRYNWSAPYVLSPHNSRTIYFGANRLFKSVNRGDSWKPVSPDLTTNDKSKLDPGKLSVTPENTGAEAHCTLTTVAESPLRAGVLWVGTDDGQVQVSQDDGATWTNVVGNIPDLPRNTWCSRVIASKWADGRAYATFDGHRSNDFKPYVYVTDDYGKTWSKLTNGLPDYDSVYVIREGEKNPDLLYLGSEMSLRVSLDRGRSWTRYRTNFPTVAVHDLVVHPRELDLVVATHGRSLWTIDASGLEQLDQKTRDQEVALLKPQDVLMLGRIAGEQWDGDAGFDSPNTQPGTRIMYNLKAPAGSTPKIVISDPSGASSVELKNATNVAGLNVVPWNGRVEGRLAPGDYRVTLTVNGKDYVTSVRVESTPLVRD
jgi:photosystem II stability/assembly factor-like uncharacterized protein